MWVVLSVVCLMYKFVWCVNECVRFFKLCCGHEHLAPMTYPGQYTRCPSLSSLTEERARELCRLHGAGSSVSHQSSGVSRDRAAAASPADITPTRTSHMPRRAPRDRHDPSSVVPNNQTMERLPVRQATIGMCVVHAVRGQTGGRCGRGTRRASELGQPRAPACSRLRGRTRDADWDQDRNGCRNWDPPRKFSPPLSFVTFTISHIL